METSACSLSSRAGGVAGIESGAVDVDAAAHDVNVGLAVRIDRALDRFGAVDERYRQRHALYKTDPDLQAAHRACPWLVTWDDHEVENNYAGAHPEIIAAMGGPQLPIIPETEYDNLYILTVYGDGPAKLIKMKYIFF